MSRKNAFSFGFSMEFADQRAYDAYSNHPDHNRFVRERWIPEVEEFLLDWETADMGAVEAARAIEPLCMLWCIPGFLRQEWTHVFKLLK